MSCDDRRYSEAGRAAGWKTLHLDEWGGMV